MRPDLVIFDCDGVLIDSEVLSADVLIELAGEHGLSLTRDHVWEHYLGRSFPTVAASVRETFGVDLVPTFEAEYRARLLTRFDSNLRITDGLLAMLAHLAVPSCVATSSSPERVRRSLAITGLTDRFPPPFTASEVPRGKPAPDLFLHAAARMGVDPARCLVIEDSLPGLAAAAAAGMPCLHYTGASHMGARAASVPGAPVLAHWRDFPLHYPDLFGTRPA
ncbi:HAD family hydrolase [Mongoliimonas terrestris]|uniref:HAD family hydrolase n=1 Tax=Mongoliimonas terrestris TaxID=1709001 RepID=UPI000949580B|nr:HAD family hydrolase [Mongoliimonas terrestris]